MLKELNDLLEKAEGHLGSVDVTVQVVLKGHLLIEQQLDEIIKTFVYHPRLIDSATLRFAQKVALARSISLDESENPMWDLVIQINSLRNELAHSLGGQKRESKIRSVLKILEREAAEQSSKFATAPEHSELAIAVFLTMGFLNSFLEEMQRFREFINVIDHAINPHRHKHNK